MNENKRNRTDLKTALPDVHKAARTLMHALASALASDFDEARRLGCTNLLVVTANFVTRRVGSQRRAMVVTERQNRLSLAASSL
jgi:hypothetical protein